MYVKLFGTILDSSIWATNLATRVVWITMLAMADEEGIVSASTAGLARRAGVSARECRAALKVLSAPDPDSRTKAVQGRRIRALEGGWQLINYRKYREIRTRKQMADALRQTRHRQRTKRDVHDPGVTSVTRHDVTTEAEAEAEAEAENRLIGSAARRAGATDDSKGKLPSGAPSPFAVLLPLVRTHLWPPDGKPPQGWTERREGSVLKALLAGAPIEQVAVWIEGLALLRDAPGLYADPVEWLGPPGTKLTCRALRKRSGTATVLELAHRAYWTAANRRPRSAPRSAAPVSIKDVLSKVQP